MSICRVCHKALSPAARFCPACGAAIDISNRATTYGADEAVAATAVTTVPTEARPSSRQSGSGWLSSANAVDHGRFAPGTLLAERYRIVQRLGQGGMGEVYRADDLKLGQPVALKFLPATLERDPLRLAQFHTEVRLARQIAHKHVCRMYDIGEAEGLPFLTMEYVDGEDLASLLRRIGRLPEDKALDLARQVCAGVSAAHERGVLHRDLKPANLMIDGQGQVRITDFGLAAIAGDAQQLHVGTPAYMGPEQLRGEEATQQSDVYALGLVLYELFTGRRAFTADTVAELVRQHQGGAITPPGALVRDLDPLIERTILRCLEADPGRRPRSALAVAAGLPGGDPLAAALAAGETPSPEMVAAAGERRAMGAIQTAVGVGVVLLLVLGVAVIAATRQITRHVPFDKSPPVLVDRAQQVLGAFGYTQAPADTHWTYSPDGDYLRYVHDHPEFAATRDPHGARPHGLSFSYRTSPRLLIPFNPLVAVSMNDPPLEVSGMTMVTLDTSGQLAAFAAVPPQRDARPPAAAANWEAAFRLAGLDLARFTGVASEWQPPADADERRAWEGTFLDQPDTKIRVEAAAWRGQPIYFQIVGPWTRPGRMQEALVTATARIVNAMAIGFFLVLLGAAVLIARQNVRANRGDRRGAARLGTIAIAGQMFTWVLNDTHVADPGAEVNRLFLSLGESLFSGGLLYVMYLALEPAVRRYWPDSLLGWSRLLQGRVLDARVGRDVLVGLGGGGLMHLLILAIEPAQALAGFNDRVADVSNLRCFEGPSYALGLFASMICFQAIFNAMWCVFAIVGFKRLLTRDRSSGSWRPCFSRLPPPAACMRTRSASSRLTSGSRSRWSRW